LALWKIINNFANGLLIVLSYMDVNMIKVIVDYFHSKPVDKVWIFGSFSRGEEHPDSDVDILIAVTPGAKFSLLDHSAMICDLEDLLNRRVDLVKEGTLLPFAQDSANHDKLLIYERAA